MARPATAPSGEPHPAPMRNRVGLLTLGFALFGGPLAWVGHELVNYMLAAYPCFPNDVALTQTLPGWGWDRGVLVIIDILALAIGAAAAFTAWRSLQAVRQEKPGSHHELLEAGEGRTRFLAVCGLLTGLGFTVAILFDTLATLIAPQCAA